MFFYFLVLVLYFSFGHCDPTCPNGTVQGPSDPNTCYKLVTDPTDWFSADSACAKQGGHLTSIMNAYENSFLLGIGELGDSSADDYWVGGTNNNLNNTWKWIDGSNFSYTYWAPGYPTPDPNFCMALHKTTGFWYSEDCRGQKPYICKLPPLKPVSTSCPIGWNYFDATKSCYKVIYNTFNNMTCNDGQLSCFENNSTLTSIHSDQEDYYVTGLTMVNSKTNGYNWVIIGIISNGLTWKWLDGSTVDYTNWYSSPQPAANNCAVIQTTVGQYNYFAQWTAIDSTNSDHQHNSSMAVCKKSAFS